MSEEQTPKNEDAPAPAPAPAEPAIVATPEVAPAPAAMPTSAMTPEPLAPLPPTIAVKSASAPLWQWVVVGAAGLLALLLATRSASTLDDAKPIITASSAAQPKTVTSIDLMPQVRKLPGMNTAPMLTVSAGPLAGGWDVGALKRDGGKPGVSTAKKGKDSYPSEGLALDAAQESLDRKDAVKASAILDQYEKDWGGNGVLGPDARALRIEALALKQQDTQALALANRFIEDYPHSPKAGRVRGIADQLRARGAK